jgi:nitrogen fixation protein FixH
MTRARLFPGIVFGLLAINAAIVGLTLYLANSDRSFAVEPGYYQKALGWDQAAQERHRSAALGWQVSVDSGAVGVTGRRICIRLTDRDGNAIVDARIRLVAFASTRAGERFAPEVSQAEPGVYTADLPADRAGLWEFRVTATGGQDSFFQTVRAQLPEAAP